MSRLIIKGGRKLKGEWRLSGNKNEALTLIAASLLFKDGIKLANVPEIKDVKIMLEIAGHLGGDSKNPAKGIYLLKGPAKTNGFELPPELSSKIRGSLLFIGPLLATRGSATIPRSGGDKIGLRKIDAHLEVFRAFGAKISGNKIALPKRVYQNGKTVEIWLSEPSVTATENALMLAAARPGKTTIKNAASEPHVVGLGLALKKGGIKIEGLGTNLVNIKGVRNLKKTNHSIGEDYMEIGNVLVLSAIWGGSVKVKSMAAENYKKIFEGFEKFGKKIVHEDGFLKATNKRNNNDKYFKIEEISDGPWPNFPTDLISPLIVLAAQVRGHFLFHEKMFESRLFFIDQLKTLGAQVVLCDPHRVLVAGPSKLYGARLVSPDIRAGMALVIAALTAKGPSIIENAEELDRGYENLVEKLKKLGADIKKE